MLAASNLKKAIDVLTSDQQEWNVEHQNGMDLTFSLYKTFTLPPGRNISVPLTFIKNDEAILAGSASGDAVVYRLQEGTTCVLHCGAACELLGLHDHGV